MKNYLRLTAHATMRMSQRGIVKEDLELIEWIGTEVEGGYLVREKDFQALDRELKQLREHARRLIGKRLVVEGDRLITGYHAARNKQYQLLRGSQARSSNGVTPMSIIMISVAPDVVTCLLALRLSESESPDEVLRRVLAAAEKPTAKPVARATAATPSANGAGVSYQFDGETHVASDATEAMINILRKLGQYDDSFFPKLAAKVRGRTRNHIAQSRSEVYPARSDLARYVKEIGPGWFIGCNIANREKKKILRAACEVMGIAFGQDLKIDLAHA